MLTVGVGIFLRRNDAFGLKIALFRDRITILEFFLFDLTFSRFLSSSTFTLFDLIFHCLKRGNE